jgi:hypothetical protein
MLKKILFAVAIVFALVNFGLGIGTIILSRMNGVDWATIFSDGGWILALSMASIGVLIALLRDHNPLGWIFLAIGFFQGLVSFAMQYAIYGLITSPGALPGSDLMSWLGQIAWFPGLVLLLTYAILLFPTGHLPSPRWRIFGWANIIPLISFLPLAISIWPFRGLTLILHPDQVTPTTGILSFVLLFSFPLVLICGLISLVSLIIRFRQADFVERRQIKWVVFAAGIFLFMEILQGVPVIYNFFMDNKISYLIVIPVSIALPAAIGIAILRYRLWDIDILINRTLVYVPLTAILSGLYAASISLLQKVFVAFTGSKSDGAVVLTTLILTSTFTPIKGALQIFVDRRFKNPVEPLAKLKTFRHQVKSVEEVVARENAAQRFLDESTVALQASGGAIFLSRAGVSQLVSNTGDWKSDRESIAIPIGKEPETIGTLYLRPCLTGIAYTETEISLLTDVAERLGHVLSLMGSTT